MPVRGLTILVATADEARLRAALGLAAAQAALGGRGRLFLDAAAVPALAATPDDAPYRAAGLPGRAELMTLALDLGVEITVCQSGLALATVSLAALDPRIGAGGLAGLLASLGEDRFVAV